MFFLIGDIIITSGNAFGSNSHESCSFSLGFLREIRVSSALPRIIPGSKDCKKIKTHIISGVKFR